MERNIEIFQGSAAELNRFEDGIDDFTLDLVESISRSVEFGKDISPKEAELVDDVEAYLKAHPDADQFDLAA